MKIMPNLSSFLGHRFFYNRFVDAVSDRYWDRRLIRLSAPCFALMLSITLLSNVYAAEDRGALVRIEGGGAPVGVGLLLLSLEAESRLEWQDIDVKPSDLTLTDLLTRVSQWPVGAITKETESLLCSRNPHVCCPIPPNSKSTTRSSCLQELRSNNPTSFSPYLVQAQKTCRLTLQTYTTDRSAGANTCGALWRFIPRPDPSSTVNACNGGYASPWSVCVPKILVRERVGIQDIPFNPLRGESAKNKFELVQGCAELSRPDQELCRAAYSEAMINAFNFGDYLERSRRDGKITLPTRAYIIEIPASDNTDGSSALTGALHATTEALKVHDRAALKIEWITGDARLKPLLQQASVNATTISSVPTAEALTAMGLDKSMPPIARSAPILAMDPTPLAKDNSRLPAPNVNAFTARELADRILACPTNSTVAYKPLEWFSPNPFASPGHATEVVGAMAAEPVDGSQVFGALNKSTKEARVHALYLDDGNGDPDRIVVDQIFEIRPVTSFWRANCTYIFPIVNVSLKFSSEGPPGAAAEAEGILFARASEPQYALYVVAAGNYDEPTSGRIRTPTNCTHLPGCNARNTQNMISVVGLTASGKYPSLSSLRGRAFEVAAIGDIITVDYAGHDKTVSGSSYAAPFVSSLASLIVGQIYSLRINGGLLQPADVKVRILQTVDFLSDRSIVEYGRINYSRALDLGQDIILLNSPIKDKISHTAPYCRTATGCYLGEVRKTHLLKQVKGFDSSGSELEIKELSLNRILRLHRSGKNTWSIVYIELATNFEKAQVIHDVQLENIDELKFSFAGEGETSIPLEQLVDYTRCMWTRGNDGVCLTGVK